MQFEGGSHRRRGSDSSSIQEFSSNNTLRRSAHPSNSTSRSRLSSHGRSQSKPGLKGYLTRALAGQRKTKATEQEVKTNTPQRTVERVAEGKPLPQGGEELQFDNPYEVNRSL